MKKGIAILIMLLMVVFMYSCGNESHDDHKNNHESHENHDEHKHDNKKEEVETHEHTSSGVSLDNGKQWVANPETTTGVDNMIHLMASFSDKDNVEAYGKLTSELKNEFTMIFEKCTMTGESHNQLHNFLVPIKDLLGTLSSNDLKECKTSYNKLSEHLGEYKKYFK